MGSPQRNEAVELTIPSRLDFLPLINTFTEEVADLLCFAVEDRDGIATSVIEAATNAIQHGNREVLREYRASHTVLQETLPTSDEPEIIPQKELLLKPMTVDEAIMQMELLNKTFLLFNNSADNNLNVIYIRDDGHFGLIQPEIHP